MPQYPEPPEPTYTLPTEETLNKLEKLIPENKQLHAKVEQLRTKVTELETKLNVFIDYLSKRSTTTKEFEELEVIAQNVQHQ